MHTGNTWTSSFVHLKCRFHSGFPRRDRGKKSNKHVLQFNCSLFFFVHTLKSLKIEMPFTFCFCKWKKNEFSLDFLFRVVTQRTLQIFPLKLFVCCFVCFRSNFQLTIQINIPKRNGFSSESLWNIERRQTATHGHMFTEFTIEMVRSHSLKIVNDCQMVLKVCALRRSTHTLKADEMKQKKHKLEKRNERTFVHGFVL